MTAGAPEYDTPAWRLAVLAEWGLSSTDAALLYLTEARAEAAEREVRRLRAMLDELQAAVGAADHQTAVEVASSAVLTHHIRRWYRANGFDGRTRAARRARSAASETVTNGDTNTHDSAIEPS